MPRVELAGYNVDAEWLAEVAAGLPASPDWTPETLSAAYARISRDPRPVGELRRLARQEVGKARAANERIVFGLGHASVAEHAVFNLDVSEVSRLAIEALESHRLASYTEKSQRYIRLGEDFVVPPEVVQAGLEAEFRIHCQRAFARYALLVGRLMASGIGEKEAGEDARYALPLAVTGQLGMTLNARSLEHQIRTLAAHPLEEVRSLGRAILQATRSLAPSLLRYMEPGPYLEGRSRRVIETWRRLGSDGGTSCRVPESSTDGVRLPEGEVRLLWATPRGDETLLAALISEAAGLDAREALREAEALGEEGRRALFEAVVAHLGPHDSLPRAFEHGIVQVELVISAAAFGQLKRHRISSPTPGPYDPALGVTVPPTMREEALREVLLEGVREAEDLARRLGGPGEPVAAYCLLNAHRRRVWWTLNLREVYHVSRLREDGHAQWDIRSLTRSLAGLVREAFPLCASRLGGKDQFPRPVQD
ncbi:MAG TPA: FAD-dependent thymidylate synthase [Myxococcota bacterium]|nr:FAD-dependent thymidylate synthase [Myxococcota bacterium]HQK50804.1 FAD-dependent thymidylate synthase [Myxococcota bacterium]